MNAEQEEHSQSPAGSIYSWTDQQQQMEIFEFGDQQKSSPNNETNENNPESNEADINHALEQQQEQQQQNLSSPIEAISSTLIDDSNQQNENPFILSSLLQEGAVCSSPTKILSRRMSNDLQEYDTNNLNSSNQNANTKDPTQKLHRRAHSQNTQNITNNTRNISPPSNSQFFPPQESNHLNKCLPQIQYERISSQKKRSSLRSQSSEAKPLSQTIKQTNECNLATHTSPETQSNNLAPNNISNNNINNNKKTTIRSHLNLSQIDTSYNSNILGNNRTTNQNNSQNNNPLQTNLANRNPIPDDFNTPQMCGGRESIHEQLDRLYNPSSSQKPAYKLRHQSAQINFQVKHPLISNDSSTPNNENLRQVALELSRIDSVQAEYKGQCDQFIDRTNNSLNNFEQDFLTLKEAFFHQKKQFEAVLLEKDATIASLRSEINQKTEQIVKQQYYFKQQTKKTLLSSTTQLKTTQLTSDTAEINQLLPINFDGGIDGIILSQESISKRLGFDDDEVPSSVNVNNPNQIAQLKLIKGSNNESISEIFQQQQQSKDILSKLPETLMLPPTQVITVPSAATANLREEYLREILGDTGFTHIQEIESSFDELTRDNKSVSDLRSKYSNLLQDLISRIHSFKDSQSVLISELNDLQQKCERLQESNSKISQEYQKQLRRLSELREKCEKFVHQRDQTCMLLTHYERQELNSIQTLQEQFAEKENELLLCQTEVDDLSSRIDSLLLLVGLFDEEKTNITKKHAFEIKQHTLILDYYDSFLFKLISDQDPVPESLRQSLQQLLSDLVFNLENQLFQRYSSVKAELASRLQNQSLQLRQLQQQQQQIQQQQYQATQAFSFEDPYQQRFEYSSKQLANLQSYQKSSTNNESHQTQYRIHPQQHQSQQQQLQQQQQQLESQIEVLSSEIESLKRQNEKLLNERMQDFSNMKQQEARTEILKIKLENKIQELKSRERQFISMMRSLVPEAIIEPQLSTNNHLNNNNNNNNYPMREDGIFTNTELDYFEIKAAIVKKIQQETIPPIISTESQLTTTSTNPINENIEKYLSELATSIEEVKQVVQNQQFFPNNPNTSDPNHPYTKIKVIPPTNKKLLNSANMMNSPDNTNIDSQHYKLISPMISYKRFTVPSSACAVSSSSAIASTQESEKTQQQQLQYQQQPLQSNQFLQLQLSEYMHNNISQQEQQQMSHQPTTINELETDSNPIEDSTTIEEILANKDDQIQHLLSVLQKSLRLICELNERNRLEKKGEQGDFIVAVSESLVTLKVEENLQSKYPQYEAITSLIESQNKLAADLVDFEKLKSTLTAETLLREEAHQQTMNAQIQQLNASHSQEISSYAEQLSSLKSQLALELELKQIAKQELQETKAALVETRNKSEEKLAQLQQQLNEEIKQATSHLIELKDEYQLKIDAVKEAAAAAAAAATASTTTTTTTSETNPNETEEQFEFYSSLSSQLRKQSPLHSDLIAIQTILYTEITDLTRRLSPTSSGTNPMQLSRESPAIDLLEKYRELISEERHKSSSNQHDLDLKSAQIDSNKLTISSLQEKVDKLKQKLTEAKKNASDQLQKVTQADELKKQFDSSLLDLISIAQDLNFNPIDQSSQITTTTSSPNLLIASPSAMQNQSTHSQLNTSLKSIILNLIEETHSQWQINPTNSSSNEQNINLISEKYLNQIASQIFLHQTSESQIHQALTCSAKDRILSTIRRFYEPTKSSSEIQNSSTIDISQPRSKDVKGILEQILPQVDLSNKLASTILELKAAKSEIQLLLLQVKKAKDDLNLNQTVTDQLKEQLRIQTTICSDFHRKSEQETESDTKKQATLASTISTAFKAISNETLSEITACIQKEIQTITNQSLLTQTQHQLDQITAIQSTIQLALKQNQGPEENTPSTAQILQELNTLHEQLSLLESTIITSQQTHSQAQIEAIDRIILTNISVVDKSKQDQQESDEQQQKQKQLQLVQQQQLEIQEQLELKLNEQTTIITELNKKLEQSDQTISNQQTQLAQFKIQHNQSIEQRTQLHQQSLTDLQAKQKQALLQCEDLSQQIRQLQLDLQAANLQVEQYQTENTVLKNTIESNQSTNVLIQTQSDQSRQAEIQTFNEMLTLSEQECEKLKQSLSQQSLLLASTQSEIQDLKQQIEISKQQFEVHSSEKTQQINNLTSQIQSLQDAQTQKQEFINILESNLSSTTAECSRLEKSQQTSEKYIASLKKQASTTTKSNLLQLKKLGLKSIDFFDGFLIMYSLLIRSHPNINIQQKFNALNFNQIITSFKSTKSTIISNGERTVKQILAQIEIAKKSSLYEAYNFDLIVDLAIEFLKIEAVYTQLESFHESLKLFLS